MSYIIKERKENGVKGRKATVEKFKSGRIARCNGNGNDESQV